MRGSASRCARLITPAFQCPFPVQWFALPRVVALMDCLHRTARIVVTWGIALLACGAAHAQFKVIGPAPYPPAVARQKIKALLDGVDPANRPQTVDTLTGLLSWYRDMIDDELIAAWQKDDRAKLIELMQPLADSRVAVGVVEFSWRRERQSALYPDYAPMFANFMTRFPESAQPFLDDLLGSPPELPQTQAETVCRILLDMPDVENWRKNALQILPHYRRAAENVLNQDLHGSDQEKSFQAQRWLADLRMDSPASPSPSAQPYPRRKLAPAPATSRPTVAVNDSTPTGDNAAPPRQLASNSMPSSPSAPTLQRPFPAAPAPAPPAPPPAASAYTGPKTGTLESTGSPIPQNAEYVFRNLPPLKLQLDYDTKNWDARLVPADGQTQKLIVKNKGSGPQKRCVVHWTIVP